MRWRTTFTVTGKFSFPMDMLRYDRCHPMRGEDAACIEDSLLMRVRDRESRETVSITLVKYHKGKDAQLTPDRWASFVWSIRRDSIRTEQW